MSLSVAFRVMAMRADESGEHLITLVEVRRPFGVPERAARQEPQFVAQGPINLGRGPQAPGMVAGMADMLGGPPSIIHVPVTPEQFVLFRIGQVLELDMGLPGQQMKQAEGGGSLSPDALRQFRDLQR